MSSQRATSSPGEQENSCGDSPADHIECLSAIHTSRGIDTKAFAFNSKIARYRAGGHFKEKTPASLSLTNQQIQYNG